MFPGGSQLNWDPHGCSYFSICFHLATWLMPDGGAVRDPCHGQLVSSQSQIGGVNGVADYFGRVKQRIGARISPSQRVGSRAPPLPDNKSGRGSTPFQATLTSLHFSDVGRRLSLASVLLPIMPLALYLSTAAGKVSGIWSAPSPYGKAWFSD